MERAHAAVYRSYDGYFAYTDAWGREGRCYLQVYEPRGALPLALATEAPDNSTASSITNAAGEVATQVWRQLLPLALEGLRWVEVSLGPAPDPRNPATLEARFAEVTFSLDGQALHAPRWRHRERAEVEALIGGTFNVPVTRSY